MRKVTKRFFRRGPADEDQVSRCQGFSFSDIVFTLLTETNFWSKKNSSTFKGYIFKSEKKRTVSVLNYLFFCFASS